MRNRPIGRTTRRRSGVIVGGTTVLAATVVVGCSTPESPGFEDLAAVVSVSVPGADTAWTYTDPWELMPQERESLMEPQPATAVVVGEFGSLVPGSAYRVEKGAPALEVLPFDSPEALWRDALLTIAVTEVIDDGATKLRVGEAVKVRVIVPLKWSTDQIESAYRSEPEAVIFLDDDALSSGYRVLGGVGEFYLPVGESGALNTGFLTEETLAAMPDFPRTVDGVRELAKGE